MKFSKRMEKRNRTKNLAGGDAFKIDEKLEIVSILVTSFCQNQFYRSASNTIDELTTLIQNAKDMKFAAKAAIYARDKGMRSITHVALANIANEISGEPWVRKAIKRGIYRVDDMTEIVAYFLGTYGKPLPKSLQRGVSDAFSKFDRYQLAKYRGEKNSVKLVDVVNLCHPRPVEKNAEALRDLVRAGRNLRSEGTWEAKLTEAGKKGTKEEVSQAKEDAWKELILERKIGYLALLRNLRNIDKQAGRLVDNACDLLKDEKLIKKSKVIPYNYVAAYSQLENRKMISACSDALDISCSNVPKFEEDSCVVFDASASMTWSDETCKKNNNGFTPIQVATLFSAILAKANNADIVHFGNNAKYLSYNPSDSTLSLMRQLVNANTGLNFVGHGTNFDSIFTTLRKAYRRIFILSDSQGWAGNTVPTKPYAAYKRKHKVRDCHLYCIDTCGYGSMQFPENQAYFLAGFSSGIFDIIKALETDKHAMINEIQKIKF